MKNRIIKMLVLVTVLAGFTACGNQNGNTPEKDTSTEPSPTVIPSDTAHRDSMINNGERLQGTDTSASGRRP
jgi:hypothetical protein